MEPTAPPTSPDRPTTAPSSLARLGRWCFDHRRAAIGLWLLVLFAVLGTAGAVGPDFSASSDAPDSESADGLAVLTEHFPQLGTGGTSGTIVFRADQGVDDPEVMAAMQELFAVVDAGFPGADGEPDHPGATVVSPYDTAGQGQTALDGPLAGQLAYAQVNLAPEITDTDAGLLGEAIRDHIDEELAGTDGVDGLEVLTGGQYLATFEPPETELIGLAFAVVVLILAFGSVLAMGLPIAVAIGGVGIGIGSITLLSNVVDAPDFTPIIGMMIGLGVGIDYALFIVTRYREGLDRGLDPRSAATIAIDTAGRAVLFAGVTVVISMLGLLLIGLGWLAGMGLGVSLTVLATMLTSVTLLPALLGLAGRRIEVTRWRGLIAAGFVAIAFLGLGLGQPTMALVAVVAAVTTLWISIGIPALRREVPRRAPRPLQETVAYRWSRTIQRHPWRWLLIGTTVLLAFSAPVLGLRLGWADEGNYPTETDARQAYDLLAEGFGPGFNGPFVITAVTDGTGDGAAQVATLRQVLADTPGVAAVTPPIPSNGVDPTADPAEAEAWLLSLVPTTAPQDEATTELVSTLRDDVIPVAVAGTGLEVAVTGQAAVQNDITEFLSARMLVFFGAVLALSFVLLMVVFRSLLVPIKAVIMNVLSIAGAYGAVVAVFQWGWAGDVLGLEGAPINPFIPMMLFAIVFGLSMDYEVFLLSRVREEFVRTGDSARSVADGLASTARVITAAAAIMVVVFGSFLFEDIREVKLFGLGLALAVLLDASLVRMLLVPATMELLGDKNWWMPAWLDRVLPRISVEGPAARVDGPTELLPTGTATEPVISQATDRPAADRELVGD